MFYDAHLLDTYFDGGADVNAGLVACSVAVKWAWTSSVTWSSSLTKEVWLWTYAIYINNRRDVKKDDIAFIYIGGRSYVAI